MMTDNEIDDVVSRVLREKFADFQRSTTKSDVDFDGMPIIQVTALYRDPNISPDKRIGVLHDIRAELIRRGEERFVFLTSEYPEEAVIEEDVE